MALFSKSITPIEVEAKLRSDEIKLFSEDIKRKLTIEKVRFETILDEKARDFEGFYEPQRTASTVPRSDWRSVESVVYFTESIASYISNTCSKIRDEAMFEKVVDIIIRFIIIHEYTHVKQIKNLELTKKKFDEEKELPYLQRAAEKEADSKACSLLSEEDEFTREICKLLISRKSIDNEMVKSLERVYAKERGEEN